MLAVVVLMMQDAVLVPGVVVQKRDVARIGAVVVLIRDVAMQTRDVA